MSNYSFLTGVDQGVDEWVTLGTPLPMLGIVAAYLGFVYRWGPKMMAERQPLHLKPFLILYNAFQVLWALYVLLLPVRLPNLQTALQTLCSPSDRSEAPWLEDVALLSWCFYLSKIIDLIDTVFFVLRKKYNQISFLHVWHHAVIVPSAWGFLKYLQEPAFLPLCLLNTGVHAIMYTYYFISALGPQYAKYIWWKKYMTWIQMVQFFGVIFYITTLWLSQCHISKSMGVYVIVNNVILIVLFGNFYLQAYKNKPKSF